VPEESSSTTAVRIAYGSTGLTVRLPADRTTVVAPSYQEAANDVPGTLREALAKPVAGRRCVRWCGPASGSRCRSATRPGRSRAG